MRSRKMLQNMPDPVQEAFRRTVALGYLGDPIEIAKGVLFLASDLASFVTGEVIHVNGGMLVPQAWVADVRDFRAQMEAQSEPS